MTSPSLSISLFLWLELSLQAEKQRLPDHLFVSQVEIGSCVCILHKCQHVDGRHIFHPLNVRSTT